MFSRRLPPVLNVIILLLAALACSLPQAAPTQAPAASTLPVDATKIALEILATENAPKPSELVDATKIALEILATENAPGPAQLVDATKVALEVQATNASLQLTQQSDKATEQANQPEATTAPPVEQTPEILATSTQDIEARMKTAKILVYEDTQDIGLWISDALNGMGLRYTHVGDAIGHLMENLNSPVDWDLIIIGAESHTKVQGEFWDVINEKVSRDKTALIVEVWYLDSLGNGKIRNLTSNCGVEYQKDWLNVESIYWLDSTHPLFASPNIAMPLINYSPYWWANPGDLLQLSPGSDATLLAGTFQKRKSDYGVLATCLGGRVIIQTFSNHDFHHDQIIKLWQNYVTYTLKNRFAVKP